MPPHGLFELGLARKLEIPEQRVKGIELEEIAMAPDGRTGPPVADRVPIVAALAGSRGQFFVRCILTQAHRRGGNVVEDPVHPRALGGAWVRGIGIVEDVDDAIRHINQYGSNHSDTVVTRDDATAQRFLALVDSAAVYWNASTRFTDGGEFGMGAEIGISTDKVGARGPMGLDELCSYKWIGIGTGQIRE